MTSPLAEFLNGLTGGAQQGYGFRTGIEDRKRRIASEDDAAQYEKARRLREDVAFGLQQRIGESNLETAAANRANLTADNARADQAASIAAYQTMFPTQKPLVQDWQREGFKTQQAWQDYHKDISRAGQNAQATTPGKNALGITSASQAIKEIRAIYDKDATALDRPAAAAAAEGMGHFPVIGPMLRGITGTAKQHLMTPNQQKVERLMNVVAHSSVGLLPGSRQSLAIFNSFLDTYYPPSGSAPETRTAALAQLEDLGRRMEQLRGGQEITENDLLAGVVASPDSAPPPLLRRSTDQPAPPPKKHWGDHIHFFKPGQSP